MQARPSDSKAAREPVDPPRTVPIILWIVPLVAAITIPGLALAIGERPMAVRLEQAIWIVVGTGAVALVLLAALTRGFRERWRWALGVSAIAVLILFQWPLLTSAGRRVSDAVPLPFVQDIVPVAIAAGFLWLAARRAGEWQFALISGLGTVALVVVLTIAALPFVELATPAPRGVAAPGSPDVVILVLDGYAGADVLATQFAHDNSSFEQELVGLGFEIAGAASANYGFTYAALSAMYELDYVHHEGELAEDAHPAMRAALSGSPEMMDSFRRAGYEIAFLENAWEGSHCGAAVDICIRDGIAERVLWHLAGSTVLAPIYESARPHPFNSVSLDHLESLAEVVAADRVPGVPRLTIAHVILPHAPFLRDAGCDYANSGVRRAFNSPSEDQIDARRGFYADQLECTNRLVLEAMSDVVSARPDTIVMITGDHGSGSTRLESEAGDDWTPDSIEERMSVFGAYRLGACAERIYPSITPVNGARVIANCALESELDLVPDLSLWAPHDGNGVVVDAATMSDGPMVEPETVETLEARSDGP